MTYLRRLILALALSAGLAPAFAQVPAPVPALPDTERRTSYSISGTTCACAVNFALYGDSTDYQNWVEVWLNGVQIQFNDASKGWALSTPSGSFASLARPITNAILTFNAVQTGTVQIVGARRPRRTTQFNEATGVPTRNLNQAFTDIIAMQRETWDKTNDVTGRAILGLPGEAIANLPSAAARASGFLCWDATGLIPMACGPLNGQGNVVGPNGAIDGHIALFSGATGLIIRDGGAIGTGDVTGPAGATANAFALFNGATGKILKNGPTIIPLASGGTNNALVASNGGIAYSDAAGIQILAGTATGLQMLQSGVSAAPAWSTATWPATTTINQLLYSSSANVVAGLATGNNGTLITSGAGIPSISSTLPAAVQLNITQLGAITAGTWTGTVIGTAFGGTNCSVASGTCLDNITGFASTGYVKRTGAGTYVFNSPIPLTDGGLNASLVASNGGLFYSTGSAGAILSGTGTANQIPLSGSNAAPSWSTTTWPNTVTTNNILFASGSNAISGLATGNNGTLITSGAGLPSISSTLPNAVQANITTVGTINTGIWNGTAITGTFIGTNTVTNSNLAQAANGTVKSNVSGGLGNVSDNTLTSVLDAVFGSSQGTIIYRSSVAWSGLAPGTPGQFLTTQGAGANPNWGSGGAGTGTVTTVNCLGVAITASGTCPEPFSFANCTLAASVATNILTVAVKDNAGNDPSATSPCRIAFRSATATTGSSALDTVTAALNITTFATGATFGSVNATAFRLWVVAFDNAGTVVLGLFNAISATTQQCFALNESLVQSSTAMSGSATSPGTFYTPNGTTLASKAIKILGYVEYNSTGLATAGTYATGPNFIQTFGTGIRRPCEPVQTVPAFNTTTDTGSSTTTFVANTNQQASITLTSAANIVQIEMWAAVQINAGGAQCDIGISRGTTNNTGMLGLFGTAFNTTGGQSSWPIYVKAWDQPNTISSQAYAGQRRTTSSLCLYPGGQGVASTNKGQILLTEIMG